MSPSKKGLSEAEYADIQGILWPIRKNSKDLTDEDLEKLNRLFEYSPDLKLAYSFREELTSIFERQLTKAEAKQQLLAWQDKISQSSLTCLTTFLTTLNNWLDKIINYFAGRFSSGFVEGLNNKIKTTKRRCYGILRNTTLFQRLSSILKAIADLFIGAPPSMASPREIPKSRNASRVRAGKVIPLVITHKSEG